MKDHIGDINKMVAPSEPAKPSSLKRAGSMAWIVCGAKAYHPGLGKCTVIEARPESEYATVRWPDSDYPSDVKKMYLIESPSNADLSDHRRQKP